MAANPMLNGGPRSEVRKRTKSHRLLFDCDASIGSSVNRSEFDSGEQGGTTMGTHWSMQSAILLTLVFMAASPTELRAQNASGSMPGIPQQASAALTGDQQSAANSALCSALGSHFPNTASVSPSALSDPAVMSTAASSFAGSTNLPLPGATDLLKGYVTQHATDILAS